MARQNVRPSLLRIEREAPFLWVVFGPGEGRHIRGELPPAIRPLR
jgi:hypothetical protein